MINNTQKCDFLPHVITGSNQDNLTDLPLNILLSEVREKKLVLIRGVKSLMREELLHYCQSQAQLLSWDFGPVMEMKIDKNTQNYLFTEGDVPLHWDGAFYQEPRFLFFHCLEAPSVDAGGETVFVDTESVWEKTSATAKDKWKSYQLSFSTDKLAHYGGIISRNLVNQHPDKKTTILRFAEPVGEDYLNPVKVSVMNKSEHDSSVILRELSEAMRNATHCYHHQWQTGDYLIADNFSLLHGRNAFSKNSPRHLRRIQLL